MTKFTTYLVAGGKKYCYNADALARKLTGECHYIESEGKYHATLEVGGEQLHLVTVDKWKYNGRYRYSVTIHGSEGEVRLRCDKDSFKLFERQHGYAVGTNAVGRPRVKRNNVVSINDQRFLKNMGVVWEDEELV